MEHMELEWKVEQQRLRQQMEERDRSWEQRVARLEGLQQQQLANTATTPADSLSSVDVVTGQKAQEADEKEERERQEVRKRQKRALLTSTDLSEEQPALQVMEERKQQEKEEEREEEEEEEEDLVAEEKEEASVHRGVMEEEEFWYFSMLPEEVAIHILSFCESDELLNLSLINWQVNRLSRDSSLWKNEYKKSFPMNQRKHVDAQILRSNLLGLRAVTSGTQCYDDGDGNNSVASEKEGGERVAGKRKGDTLQANGNTDILEGHREQSAAYLPYDKFVPSDEGVPVTTPEKQLSIERERMLRQGVKPHRSEAEWWKDQLRGLPSSSTSRSSETNESATTQPATTSFLTARSVQSNEKKYNREDNEALEGDGMSEETGLDAKKETIATQEWKLKYWQRKKVESCWMKGRHKHTKLRRHEGSVYSLAIDKHNRFLASGSSDRSVCLFDITSGECLTRLEDHCGSVMSLQMEENMLFTGGGTADNTLKVWDLDLEKCIATLRGHSNAIFCLECDENVCVTGSRDQTIKVWDFRTGLAMTSLGGQTTRVLKSNGQIFEEGSSTAGVWCLQYDSHTQKVVAGYENAEVGVWDLRMEALIATLHGHQQGVRALQFDSQMLATGSNDYTVKLWDMNTFTEFATLKGRNMIWCLQFDESKILTGGKEVTLEIWDRNNLDFHRTHEWQESTGSVSCLHFQDHLLASGSSSGVINIADFSDYEALPSFSSALRSSDAPATTSGHFSSSGGGFSGALAASSDSSEEERVGDYALPQMHVPITLSEDKRRKEAKKEKCIMQ
ncbi:Scytalone dehydratase [Balamuthia mandrillaris]